MALYLGILLFSFILTGVAIVPFIDFLFKLHFTYKHNDSKFGTPIGAGALLIFMITFLYAILLPILIKFGVYVSSSFPIKEELNIIFFTFISFGLVGLYDDILKIFRSRKSSRLLKIGLQITLSLIISAILYFNLHIQIIYLPIVGVLNLSWLYVPVSAIIILFFTRAFNLADRLDGLASGLLLICLLALWGISTLVVDTAISIFIALWVGSLITFIYFNVYPARVWLGNTGSLAFGSTLAVIGLLLGKVVPLFFIAGIFVFNQLFQLIYKVPFHSWLLKRGWPESKIVMRSWIIAITFAIFGLWLAGV